VTRITVVAAVIERDGRWLLGRRPEHKRHGGLWEFPGGKVDPGEGMADATRRELAEELALEVTHVGDRLMTVDDDASPFVIEFLHVHVTGTPRAIEHSVVGWYTLDMLQAMPLAPADAAFVAWLSRREPGDSVASPPPSPWVSRS
jgi:mutator protein MutT